MIKKILKFFVDPKARFSFLSNLGLCNWMSDEKFLIKKWVLNFGTRPDFERPKTFNEKLQWLKMHDRKDIYTTMVDKYEAKKYVAGIIGDEHIITTLGVYDKFDDIDFGKLPNQFVMKCTHDSGGLIICRDKKQLDIEGAKKKINKCLKRNYFYFGREWPYKNVKPRIVIEKYMEDESGYQLKDYKLFCFNGEPELIMVDSDRFSGHKRNVYDKEWRRIDVNINFPSCDVEFKKPKNLGEVLDLSRKLSKGIPFVRIDFYIIRDKVYFGEITFYPGSGFQVITPEKWNKKLGDMIDLRNFGCLDISKG